MHDGKANKYRINNMKDGRVNNYSIRNMKVINTNHYKRDRRAMKRRSLEKKNGDRI